MSSDGIRSLLRPLAVRVANSIARAVVQLVDDATGLQGLQLGVLDGEDLDECERFQEYGFYSVPLTGAEAVVVFPNGDRGHPLVVAVDDRRYRPTGGDAGDAGLYCNGGAIVTLKANGDVYVRAASGRKVYVDDGAGGSEQLITKSQFDAHKHSTGVGPSGVPDNVLTSGTSVLYGK